MQGSLVKDAGEQLPAFNDFLVKDFKKTIEKMPDYLDAHFRNTVGLFDNVKYSGYRILPPIQSVKWRMNHSINRGRVTINKSTQRVAVFHFQLDEQVYEMHVTLPYLDDFCVYLNDNKNYPLFLLMEKGIMPFRDMVTVKAATLVLKFYRNELRRIVATDGTVFREYNITVKIHWSKKMKTYPPIILYHLMEHGWYKTLKMYDIPENGLFITDSKEDNPDFYYFYHGIGAYVKVRKDLMEDFRIVRFVISLLACLDVWKGHYSVSDIYDPSANLFRVILGKLISPGTNDPTQLMKYTSNHERSYIVMLDPSTRYRFSKMGYPCENMSDLLLHTFYNVDNWLMQQPKNLYNKKFGYLEPMLDRFIKQITTQQYYLTGPAGNPIRHEDVKKFINKISAFNPRWFEQACRSNPDIVNNSMLFSIGLKMERRMSGAGRAKSVPEEMLISHPSWLVVESPTYFPSSKPIMSGSVNPYVIIDGDGDVLENPELSSKLENVYD